MIDSTRHPHIPRAGYYFHHASTGLAAITPTWNRRTVFKPLGIHVPGLDPGDNHNWYHALPDAVRSAGVRRRVNFLNRPHDFGNDDIEATPYELLRQCAWDLSRDRRHDWRWMFHRDRHARLALPTLRPTVLMQGWVYSLTDRDLRTAPMTNALLVLSTGALRSMGMLLHDDEAVEQLFDPGTPHFLELYRHTDDFHVAEGWKAVRECEHPSEQDAINGGTRHLICRMLTPAPGRYLPRPTTQDHQSFRGWDTVVRRLSTAQQIHLLATAFPAKLIAATFKDTRYEAKLPTHLTVPSVSEAPHVLNSGGGGGDQAA